MIANVRKNLEASVVGILEQSYTVLMTLAGFVLFGEQVTLFKIIGILMIVGGNVLVFWQQKKNERDEVCLDRPISLCLQRSSRTN